MLKNLRDQSNDQPVDDSGWFSQNNPDRRRNFWIAGAIALAVIIFGCLGFFAIRNRNVQQTAPATAAPVVEAPAATEAPIVADQYTPAQGADSLLCPYPDAEVAFVDIGSPVTLLGRNEDNTYVYVGDPEGHLGFVPMNAMWVNGNERRLTVEEIATLTVVTNECSTAEEDTTAPVVVAPEQVEIVDFPVPGNYDPLYNEEGDLIGITYPIQDTGPHSIPSCNKCTLIVAVGKFTFSGTIVNQFTGLFGASEVTGNILAGVCDQESGCVTPMIGAKAGHLQVTIVFPGYEIPNESAVWSVNFMFNPESSNCGDGCLEVYFGNLNNGTIKKFDKEITATDLNLIVPDGPYPKINIVVDGIPSGSKVITNDAGDPIGQKYYLADKEAHISVPEDGGTVFYFGTACTRDGISQKAGDVVTMYGIKSDGGTPHDQNETVELVCSQPEMVLVHFFHGGNFDEEIIKLKSEFPDWNWP